MSTATSPDQGMPTVVFVHGAWYGQWSWSDVRRELDQAAIPCETVGLTSVGEQTDRLGGLADDVAAISTALDGLTGPFILVGHSYGGVPVTEVAASRDDVAHVVYVCAFAIPAGTSLIDAVGGEPPEWWIVSEDGSFIMPDAPGEVFFNECTSSVADDAIARLRPHSTRSVHEPLRAAAYGDVPATYVVCERDASTPADVQRARAEVAGAETVSLDTDHSPMLSSPAELATVVSGTVRTTLSQPS